MAKVFTIEPNPHWVIIDNFSKLPNGAAIYTYRSKNPTEFKAAFQDAGGNIPYGQPIVGGGNGTMPPIFWEFDDTAPDEGYYIRVYDSDNPNTQNFLWDFQGLFGGGSGGGGTVTTNNDIENLVINGQFFNNIGDQAGSPSVGTNIVLAPSNHSGFEGYANSVNDGPVGPDIIFAKNIATSSDNITFVPVFPLGSNNLGTNPTPSIFVNYECTAPVPGETYKFFQFPLVKGLQNTSGQTFGIKIFARLNSGTNNVNLNFRQFFGNGPIGVPSADVVTNITTLSLNNSWNTFIINGLVVPSITGKTPGQCGNDALYLQITMPLSVAVNVDFILPAVYLAAVTPDQKDFHTLDEVNAIVNSPRTGDIRFSVNSFNPYGWVPMNDGTIGNASSGSTTRANIDTFPLFNLIWNIFKPGDQTLAQMFTSAGAPIAYGADPVTDFTLNRRISLTKQAGRLIAGVGLPSANSVPVTGGTNTGTTWAIGQTTGNELHTQSLAELATHNHNITPSRSRLGAAAGVNDSAVQSGTQTAFLTATISNAGDSTPFNVQQPTSYLNIFIKL